MDKNVRGIEKWLLGTTRCLILTQNGKTWLFSGPWKDARATIKNKQERLLAKKLRLSSGSYHTPTKYVLRCAIELAGERAFNATVHRPVIRLLTKHSMP